MDVHFINLTNGMFAVEKYKLDSFYYLRIQSTACEQKRWLHILQDLSHDFLINVAMGNNCYIYDQSEKNRCPRSLWQGVEWINYYLNRRWLNNIVPAYSRSGMNVSGYFDQQYRNIDKSKLTKIDYCGKFLFNHGVMTDAGINIFSYNIGNNYCWQAGTQDIKERRV